MNAPISYHNRPVSPSALRHSHLMFGRPQADVASIEDGCHEIRELVGGAGKGWHAKLGERNGMRVAVARCALITQSQQSHNLYAATDQLSRAL